MYDCSNAIANELELQQSWTKAINITSKFWFCIYTGVNLSITTDVTAFYGSDSSAGSLFDDLINTLRQRQDGHHFPDDIFKWIFLNENVWMSINISLKFVPKGQINNIPTLVQVMAWPLPGPLMVRLPTHICVTRPQWVNIIWGTFYQHSTPLLMHNALIKVLSINEVIHLTSVFRVQWEQQVHI